MNKEAIKDELRRLEAKEPSTETTETNIYWEVFVMKPTWKARGAGIDYDTWRQTEGERLTKLEDQSVAPRIATARACPDLDSTDAFEKFVAQLYLHMQEEARPANYQEQRDRVLAG